MSKLKLEKKKPRKLFILGNAMKKMKLVCFVPFSKIYKTVDKP